MCEPFTGSPIIMPPSRWAQDGGGPGFLRAAARSSNVFPSSSRTMMPWCGSFPLTMKWKLVTPAGIWCGASKAYSRAVMVTTLGAAAVWAGGAAVASAFCESGPVQAAAMPTAASPVKRASRHMRNP